MENFGLYFNLGFEHIADIKGYDHILFLVSLCGIYLFKNWKKVLVLVTAFTIGHSITLALASLKIIIVNSALIELLIPITILITAISNILTKKTDFSSSLHKLKYIVALFFGLIHGLGFSNYLRSLLGVEENITGPLFAFNLGLEAGQIAIVILILTLAYIFINVLKTPRREWNLVLSGAALGISLIMTIERALTL